MPPPLLPLAIAEMSQASAKALPMVKTKAVTEHTANLKLQTEEEKKAFPPMLRLPTELRIKIYEYYVFDLAKNRPLKGSNTPAWWSRYWDMQCKGRERSYLRPVLLEMRILLNVCHEIRKEVALLDTPMTAGVLDVGNRKWKPIDPKLLGSVWVRFKTSDTITAAKIRVEQQVEGLSGCVIAGGKEHHFGIMYFTAKPELGAKVFKKDVRIGLGRRVLGEDLGVMRDRPVRGPGKGIPVGLPAGVKVKRLVAVADY